MALTTYLPLSVPQGETYLKNGWSQDTAGVQFPLQVGVPVQTPYMFKVVPAPRSTDCVSSANYWWSGGQPLNTKAQGTAQNVTSKPVTINGQSGVQLDCERCLALYVGGGSIITATTVTVTGYNYRGKALTFSYAVEATPGTQFNLPTPISIVTSVKFSPSFEPEGSPFIQFSVGTSNLIGLPYRLSHKNQYILSLQYAGASISPSTQATSGLNWRVTSPTIAGNSGCGYITCPSDTNGSNVLTCCYYIEGADGELSREMEILNQSSLKVGDVQKSTGPQAQQVFPEIISYDLTGVVYPADSAFINTYNKLKLS